MNEYEWDSRSLTLSPKKKNERERDREIGVDRGREKKREFTKFHMVAPLEVTCLLFNPPLAAAAAASASAAISTPPLNLYFSTNPRHPHLPFIRTHKAFVNQHLFFSPFFKILSPKSKNLFERVKWSLKFYESLVILELRWNQLYFMCTWTIQF